MLPRLSRTIVPTFASEAQRHPCNADRLAAMRGRYTLTNTHDVSTAVNSPGRDVPELLEPVAP
jgi:hypothetical protein